MGREVRRIWIKGDISHKVKIVEMEETDNMIGGDEAVPKKNIRYYLYIDNNLIDNSKSFEEAKGLAALKLKYSKDVDIWEQIA